MDKREALQTLDTLIHNAATRNWEKELLTKAAENLINDKSTKITLEKLEFDLRPLATRNNLTPAVADFYLRLINDPAGKMQFNYGIHYQSDSPFQHRAIFSGGCFWCLVEPFDTRPGIKSVVSGYTGGHTKNPTYAQVGSHQTGHVEAVEIIYDSRFIKYQEILEIYWQMIDPTDAGGQFDDRSDNYLPAIFYTNNEQHEIAAASQKALQKSGKYAKPIVVPIKPATSFWPAENYHQNFYKKFKSRYRRLKRTRAQILFFLHLHAKFREFFHKTDK